MILINHPKDLQQVEAILHDVMMYFGDTVVVGCGEVCQIKGVRGEGCRRRAVGSWAIVLVGYGSVFIYYTNLRLCDVGVYPYSPH